MCKLFRIGLLIVLAYLLSACGPSSEVLTATAHAAATSTQQAIPTLTPDPEFGEIIFNKGYLETSGRACHYCHPLNESESGRIPLMGLASYAGERVSGLGAEAYIRQSILDPGAYTLEGFASDAMPKIYGQIFTENELNQLVAFLMTLK